MDRCSNVSIHVYNLFRGTRMNILIADPDTSWAMSLKRHFNENNLRADLCATGKEAQLQVYKSEFDSVILDLDIQNHSSLEVLKYLKVNHPELKVVITSPRATIVEEWGLTEEKLKKLGIGDLIIKPIEAKQVMQTVIGHNYDAWNDLTQTADALDKEEIQVDEDEFSRIHYSNFMVNDIAIMDFFLKIGGGKFVKLYNKGDMFESAINDKYFLDKGIEYLYFKKSDRGQYLNYMNQLMDSIVLEGRKISTQKMVKTFEDVIDKYLAEIYESGINKAIMGEGLKICDNMYKVVQKDSKIAQSLDSIADLHHPTFSHQFLTCLFSVIMTKNIEWSTKRTTDFISMGALFHGIGKLKLTREILEKSYDMMGPEEQQEYQRYPIHGYEILSSYSMVPEPVRQIVYQHRELVNAGGFPNALSGTKIYPMAKTVSVAYEFSAMMINHQLKPLDALNQFVTDRNNLTKFDAPSMKALILGFINKPIQ